jgi:hypothetical protein
MPFRRPCDSFNSLILNGFMTWTVILAGQIPPIMAVAYPNDGTWNAMGAKRAADCTLYLDHFGASVHKANGRVQMLFVGSSS